MRVSAYPICGSHGRNGVDDVEAGKRGRAEITGQIAERGRDLRGGGAWDRNRGDVKGDARVGEGSLEHREEIRVGPLLHTDILHLQWVGTRRRRR